MASAKAPSASNAPITSSSIIPLNGQLPAGFNSPFKRVQMTREDHRIEAPLCCVAMLTQKTLAEIKALALKEGLPQYGCAFIYPDLVQKLLAPYGLWCADDWQIAKGGIDEMPEVALVLANYNEDTDCGNWVLWHRVKASDKYPTFEYVIDTSFWIDAKKHITTDLSHLFVPKQDLYYIEIKPLDKK